MVIEKVKHFKKTFLFIIVGIICFIILVFFIRWINLNTAAESTIYSNRYSEIKFDSVKIGMSKDQVIQVVGMPLNEIQDINSKEPRSMMYYSAQGPYGSVWQKRIIVIGPKGRVVDIIKSKSFN